MYMNYRRCHKCSCMNNNCSHINTNALEDKCNDVSNCYNNNACECECGFDEDYSPFPSNPMFGQSYVPVQIMDETFTPCVGLKMGTIFPELVSPYMPNQSAQEIAYIEKTNTIKEGCNKC